MVLFPEPRCTRIDELTAKSLSRKTLGELMVLFCKPVCFLLSWFSKKCLQSNCALIGVCYVTREQIKYTSAPHFTRIFENLLENMSENMHLCDNICRQFLAFFTFEWSSKSFASACFFLFSFISVLFLDGVTKVVCILVFYLLHLWPVSDLLTWYVVCFQVTCFRDKQ